MTTPSAPAKKNNRNWIRKVRQFQLRHRKPIIPLAPVKRLIQNSAPDFRIAGHATQAIRDSLQKYMYRAFLTANTLTTHRKGMTVEPRDYTLAKTIRYDPEFLPA